MLIILDKYDSHSVGVSIGSQNPFAKCHRTEKKIPTLKIFQNLSTWCQLEAAHRQRDNRETTGQCWSPQCPHSGRWQGREKGLKADALTDILKHKSQKKCEQRYNKEPGTQPQNYQRGSQVHWLYEKERATTCASHGCSPGSWSVMLEWREGKQEMGTETKRSWKAVSECLVDNSNTQKTLKDKSLLQETLHLLQPGWGEGTDRSWNQGVSSAMDFMLCGRAGKESCCRQSVR